MQIRQLLACLPFVLGAVSVGPAAAQGPYAFAARVVGDAGQDHLQLHIEFSGYHWSTVLWTGTPAGIDLYRRQVGVQCGAFERINSEPFAWTWQSGVVNPMNIEFADPTAIRGVAYEYMVRAVDAERHSIPADPDASLGFASYGEALIGHGFVRRVSNCGAPGTLYEQQGCEQECVPPFFKGWPPETLERIADTAQAVTLYGEISMVFEFCGGGYVSEASVTRVEPHGCVVNVRAATWSESKLLYR